MGAVGIHKEGQLPQQVRAAQAVAAGGFESSEQAAWEVSLTVTLPKVSTYERECERFRHKYSDTVESLRSAVEGFPGKEDFSLEDDLVDWEFAESALRIWKERLEIGRHAAS
jgi:hypothetical protein